MSAGSTSTMVASDVSPASATDPARVVRSRWTPALIHLLVSVVLVGLGTYLLVRLWYPDPFAQLAGGLSLLALLIGVDLALGPTLTLVAATPGKHRRVFARDLIFIAIVQATGWGYGVHSLAVARPVGLVFEVDQMRLVSAADVPEFMLAEAAPEFRSLSWSGPRLMAAAKPVDAQGLAKAVGLAMGGVELGMLPGQWRTYADFRDLVLTKARPAVQLRGSEPHWAALQAAAKSASVPPERLRYLPLVARHSDGWVTIVAEPDARVIAHLRLSLGSPGSDR